MKKFFSSRKLNIVYSVIAIAFMWAVWAIAYRAVGNKLIVPSYEQTFSELWEYLKSRVFWTALGNTVLRTLIAFLISLALAGICAALAALTNALRAALRPIIAFIRIIPTFAVILIIMRGTEANKNIAPVIVTVLVLFPIIYAQIIAAVDGIDVGLKNLVKVYKISKPIALFRIYLPCVAPSVISQTGANISLGLKIMVSGEVLAFTLKGVGGLMEDVYLSYKVAYLAALTIAVVAVGLILDVLFSQLSRITKKWSGNK